MRFFFPPDSSLQFHPRNFTRSNQISMGMRRWAMAGTEGSWYNPSLFPYISLSVRRSLSSHRSIIHGNRKIYCSFHAFLLQENISQQVIVSLNIILVRWSDQSGPSEWVSSLFSYLYCLDSWSRGWIKTSRYDYYDYFSPLPFFNSNNLSNDINAEEEQLFPFPTPLSFTSLIFSGWNH